MQPQVQQSQPDANAPEKIAQPQQVAQAQPENVQVAKTEESAPPIKSEENQANWKAFREQRESDRKAKAEAERVAALKAAEAEALKQAMEALMQKPSSRHTHDNGSEVIEESEDAIIERKIAAALKKDREAFIQEQQEKERREAPQRIMQMHPDFNQIVTTENCDYIDYHYPELVSAFKHMPDGLEKWSAMYRTIKRFVPNADSRRDAARADKNMQKPGSVSTTAAAQATPGAAVLSEDRRRSNWERMMKTMKGVS